MELYYYTIRILDHQIYIIILYNLLFILLYYIIYYLYYYYLQ